MIGLTTHEPATELQPPRPATGVSRALRARSVPGVFCQGVLGPFEPRLRSVQKVSPECPECPDTFLALRGHSRETFWTLRSPRPEGPQRHPEGHSRTTSGPKGPRDSYGSRKTHKPGHQNTNPTCKFPLRQGIEKIPRKYQKNTPKIRISCIFWVFQGYLKGYFGESRVLYVGGSFAFRWLSYSVAGRGVVNDRHPMLQEELLAIFGNSRSLGGS